MRLLDPAFREHLFPALRQCGLTTVVLMICLALFNVLEHTTLMASLGATAFILFTMPHRRSSRARYVVGILVGMAFGALYHWLEPTDNPAVAHLEAGVFGAIAVGASIFIMAITDTEDPPAAAVALGIVIGPWQPLLAIALILAVAGLVVLRNALRPRMRDLL
ncbi:HPP family protein [bacterium]|nr:HPP family protein [bacterium]